MIIKIICSLALFFSIISPGTAAAETSGMTICPLNCEEDRILSFQEPPMGGEDVRELQEQLYGLGIYNGQRNGIFDQTTYQAVKNFQEKVGLNPDGNVSSPTWAELGKATEKIAAASPRPAPTGDISIIVDTHKRKLTVYSDGEPYRQFQVAVGKYETPTPIGNFKVSRKAVDWGTGFGTRWIGLNVGWGIYGIHGTNKPNSIGDYSSHGCIRMHNRHVEELYPWIPTNAPVIVVGNPFGYLDPSYKILRRDDRGAVICEVQRALKQLGYDIQVDGVWGWGMEEVVVKFRKDKGLSRDNCIDRSAYKALGLR